MSAIQDAIVRAAQAYGLDPATMLAIAQRESSFDPNNRPYLKGGRLASSATGLFQLLNAEKRKYGGWSSDPYEQSLAGARYMRDVHDEMTRALGRAPTGPELYAGHYWGGTRAARLVSGRVHPETPVGDVFSRKELIANPNMARAGTVGRLTSSVMGDISRRAAKFGGPAAPGNAGPSPFDFAQFGEPETDKPVSFAQFGEPESRKPVPTFAEFGQAMNAPPAAPATGTAPTPAPVLTPVNSKPEPANQAASPVNSAPDQGSWPPPTDKPPPLATPWLERPGTEVDLSQFGIAA
jgi:hypothetical protein